MDYRMFPIYDARLVCFGQPEKLNDFGMYLSCRHELTCITEICKMLIYYDLKVYVSGDSDTAMLLDEEMKKKLGPHDLWLSEEDYLCLIYFVRSGGDPRFTREVVLRLEEERKRICDEYKVTCLS